MRPLVIYHGQCIDGFTAAWAVREAYRKTAPAYDPEYFPASYNSGKPVDIPDVTDREVTIVDFSLPRQQMIQVNEKARTLQVLDHHKTAQMDCQGLDFCLFDMNRSGAGIAWDHFHTEPRPWLIEAVEDRDLWRFEHPFTKPVHAYLASQEQTFECWSEIADMDVNSVCSLGEGALAYLDAYVRKMRVEWQFYTVGGHLVPCVNAPYIGTSELVGAVAEDNPECKFAVGWWQGRIPRTFNYSLRSRGDFDVSAIAKLYGGGGHKNAAGFVSDFPPWQLPLVDHSVFAKALLATLDDTQLEFKNRLANVVHELKRAAGEL